MDVIEMTGRTLDVLPADFDIKGKVMDETLEDMKAEIEKEIMGKLEDVTVKDLVGVMREKVTEKGLSYMI